MRPCHTLAWCHGCLTAGTKGKGEKKVNIPEPYTDEELLAAAQEVRKSAELLDQAARKGIARIPADWRARVDTNNLRMFTNCVLLQITGDFGSNYDTLVKLQPVRAALPAFLTEDIYIIAWTAYLAG
jgi:hypothetical protein